MAGIASTKSAGKCENVTVTTAAGKVYDLGAPDSKLFKLRLALYKIKRGLR